MSGHKLTRRGAHPEHASARADGTARAPSSARTPARRRRARLDPGQRALEHEADRYAAGETNPALRGAGRAPDSVRGGGKPLEDALLRIHESRLGRDLSGLRVHDGPEAAAEIAGAGASALAEQGDLVFGADRFRPGDRDGQRLLAHEVAHAAQQADGRASGPAYQDDPGLFPQVPAPVVHHGDNGAIAASVYFSQGDFLLTGAGARAVQQLRGALAAMAAGARVRVDAHASGEGSDRFNLELSERRRLGVLALLMPGLVSDEVVMTGNAHGEALARVTETASAATELEAQRARNRRVEIVIVPNWSISADPDPDAPPPPIDLDLDPPPPIPPPDPGPDLSDPPPGPRRQTFSVCGVWSERTRTWFDHRLRDLGIGEDIRGTLADLGVGLVGKLATAAVEEVAGAAGASERETQMIMSTLEQACRQEFGP